ncbi:MAG: VWA domain-containing protein [Myxococcales bacterium]|nr:VWA domain-containing protein [Myxococcales bacterium]
MIPVAIEPDLTYARRDCGWGALDTAMGRLPLAAVDIDARVVGLTSTTEIRQTFVNHLREALEATYVFPLPDRAAVQRFRMVTGDRVIEGVLDERGAARASYDQAIARGQRAAIAEEDRAGVFTLRVGNVMPGEVVTIALTLSGPVPIDDGEVTWVFPLVVAPRYVPGAPLPGEQAGLGVVADTDAVPDASRISPPVLLPGMPSAVRLGVRLSVDGGGLPVAQLRANLADVDARADGRGWQIALRPGQRLDRDLVLRWQLGGAALASSAVWAPDAAGAGGTLAVTVVPPVGSASGGRPRDVVVVLDRSGSMEGWKMVAARRAAARIVDSLTERDRLAVIAFDNQCELPRPHGGALVPATDRHRFEAVQFLAGVDARGGTELAEPLRRAAKLLRRDAARDQVIVLVTDGQVGNEDQILAALGSELARLRVFTLGIDQAVNAAFLRRLAGLGGGACELVESEDRLDEVMGKIHRRIATPLLTALAIDTRFVDPHSQAPRRLPAVFAGAPVTVYLRADRPDPGQTVTVHGRLPAGTPTALTVVIDPAPTGVDLEAAWARARIRDLEDRYAAGESTPALEREIVATSLRHRVLSRFTAFVAIDRAVVNPGGTPRGIVQPVEPPAGWDAKPTMRTQAGVAAPMPRPSAPPSGRYGAPGLGGMVGMGRGAAPPNPAKTVSGSIGTPFSDWEAAMAVEAEEASEAPADERAAPAAVYAPPPPPPGQPPAPARSRSTTGGLWQRLSKREARKEAAAPAGLDARPYHQRLALLADELAAAATHAQPATAAQLPTARLRELVEDARSVGLTALAQAIEPLLARLTAALTAADLVAVLVDVATALRRIATGAAPTPTPTPTARRSFWK